MPAGYSGTPLPKKLGIKDGHSVGLYSAPGNFVGVLGELPPGTTLKAVSSASGQDVVLLFVRNAIELDEALAPLKERLDYDAALWVCWPKKSSPLFRDLTGDGVRARGLATGLVDIKVCAVDDDWSGLKFVHRLKDRPKASKKK